MVVGVVVVVVYCQWEHDGCLGSTSTQGATHSDASEEPPHETKTTQTQAQSCTNTRGADRALLPPPRTPTRQEQEIMYLWTPVYSRYDPSTRTRRRTHGRKTGGTDGPLNTMQSHDPGKNAGWRGCRETDLGVPRARVDVAGDHPVGRVQPAQVRLVAVGVLVVGCWVGGGECVGGCRQARTPWSLRQHTQAQTHTHTGTQRHADRQTDRQTTTHNHTHTTEHTHTHTHRDA